MNVSKYLTRRFAASDTNNVIRLLKLTFGFQLSREWWDWKYTSNPAGCQGEEGDIWIAESMDEVVGHVAVIPQRMKRGSDTVTVAQMVDAATHPRYRGLGISNVLMRNLCSDVKNRYGLIFGFPNETFHRHCRPCKKDTFRAVEFYKFLNLDSSLNSYFTNEFYIGAAKVALHILHTAENLSSRLRLKKTGGDPVDIQRAERFPEEIDHFWERIRSDYATVLERNALFLNWRFSKHLGNYQIHLARSVGDERIIGYMVVRKTETERIKNVLNIVDIHALPGEDRCVLSLIEKAESIGQGMDLVRCRLPGWHKHVEMLQKRGFVSFMHILRWMNIYQPQIAYWAAKENKPRTQEWFYSFADADDA